MMDIAFTSSMNRSVVLLAIAILDCEKAKIMCLLHHKMPIFLSYLEDQVNVDTPQYNTEI